MKKTVKFLTMGMLFIGMTTLVGCKKEDMSKYATKDDLNNYATNSDLNNSQAKVFNYNLTFSAGSTFASYNGVSPYYEAGDVIVTYYLFENLGDNSNPDYFWVSLPFKEEAYGINWFAEFSSADGFIFINAEKSNGSSPFSSSFTNGFKSVLIKANGLKTHPDLDLANYEEVLETFGLE